MYKYDESESYHGAYEKDMLRSLKKATTTISSSMLIFSPPSHMPARKAFPLELSCPKVGTEVKKKWKVGEEKGGKENACDANLTIPFSPIPLPFCSSTNFRAITRAKCLLRRPVLKLRRDCPFYVISPVILNSNRL